MFGLKKCHVCGHLFKLDKERVYTFTEAAGVIQGMFNPIKRFDAMDCPRCGCQNALAVRMPADKAAAVPAEGEETEQCQD